MKLLSILPALVVVAGGLVNVISAQVCPSTIEYNGETITVPPVESQELLDIIARDCTIFEGNLSVATNFTGLFLLQNVTTITGYLLLGEYAYEITSIDMPDLLSMGQLIVNYPPSLTSINLPKLTTIDTMSIEGYEKLNVSAPSLQNATDITLNGNLDSLDFSQLETIQGNLSSCTDYTCDSWEASSALELDLPALRNASLISLVGDISSLSVPVLATVGAGISITNNGNGDITLSDSYAGGRTNVSFPQLNSLGGALKLSGYIGNVYLPALQNTTADINIDASSSLTVNLTSLEGANDINLQGSISGAAFPALKHVHNIDISSDVAIDCNPMQTFWNQLSQMNSTTGNFTCKTSYNPTATYSYQTQKSSGLSGNAVIGIVLGVVGGLIVILVIVLRIRHRRHKRGKVPVQETNLDEYRWRDGEDENEELERVSTPPPAYTRD